ncbi:MAG: hypothetical protein AB1420_04255 [Bacillota bacterium]
MAAGTAGSTRQEHKKYVKTFLFSMKVHSFTGKVHLITKFIVTIFLLVKENLGLPSGCAPSNAMYMWKKSAGCLRNSLRLQALPVCRCPSALEQTLYFTALW